MPEGIDNKIFYIDMVKCLDLTKEALENKNAKYVDDIGDLIIKHTEKDFFKIIYGEVGISEASKNNYGLNDKEQEILNEVLILNQDLRQYLDEYFESDSKSDKLIDIELFHGDYLLKQIQKTIGVMGIEYNFENK